MEQTILVVATETVTETIVPKVSDSDLMFKNE